MKILAANAQADSSNTEARQSLLFSQSPIPNAESRLLVAGVDEAGRGPLAGPVAVAAVVFDPNKPRINGLDDSKQLTAERREQLYARIVDRALAWSVVLIDSEEIDRINIYQATMLGMRRAVEGVAHVAGFARIDGNRVPKAALPGRGADRRRRAGPRHHGRLDRGQGHPRPADARTARATSRVSLRPAQGLQHADAPGCIADPRAMPAASTQFCAGPLGAGRP